MNSPSSIRVLHVDDEPDFADMAATFLEREDDRLSVTTAMRPDEGMTVLETEDVDCIVSDYDMPRQNGIAFLETVREEDPDLPFILFTGKGSEEVASEAISAGVTDYLQKTGDTNQYKLLANRIVNAVEAAQAERAQRRQLRAIENAQEGISIIAEDGTFRYVNEAYADLYGYEPEEMIGESFEMTYPEGALEVVQADVIPTIEEAGFWHGETTGLRADGSTFVEDHTLAKTEDGELICSVRDKSERTAHRQAIEGLHSAVQGLMEAETGDEVAEIAVSAVTTVVGEADTVAYRYDADVDQLEPVGWTEQAASEGDEPEVIARGEHDAWQAFETGVRMLDGEAANLSRADIASTTNSELWLPLGDHGLLRVTALEGRSFDPTDVALVQTVAAHVTTAFDSVRSRQELRDEREFIDQAIDTLEDVFLVLGTDGTPRRWNDRLETVTGYDDGTIPDMDIAAFFDDADRGIVSDAFEDTLEFGRATFESDLLTTDGDRVPYEFANARLTDADGNVTGVVSVGRDVSRRKERERRLERQNERLDEFASIISHDLRNPLNVARGHLELLREECDSQHVEAVEEAHGRMETLIDDILSVARKGETALDVEDVRLGEAVAECWAHVRTHDATLVTESDRTIRADRTQLRQLLENCIRNAVEHGGPDVTVRVGDLPDGFYVEDDGAGIPESEYEEVFEPGYSQSADGTGLGLNIVRGIAEAHGWTVSVAESEDGGARFEITGVERNQ